MQDDGERRSPDRARLGDLDDLAHRGGSVGGPPWILGLRGSPLEAPENTLASLRRAIDLGLDGIAYDVRACATGEAVLLRDATLDRTTDGSGLLAEKTLPDLAALDAGGWFRARFRGERLALLEEALDLSMPDGRRPRNLVWLREPGLVREAGRVLQGIPRGSLLVASSSRETCLEIRDAGLDPMFVMPVARGASEEARAFVRDERIRACAVESGTFGVPGTADAAGTAGAMVGGGPAEWSAERWSLGADSPEELLAACRAPYAGIATREPLRALALRALCALAPDFRGPHPLLVPNLEMHPDERRNAAGDWRGSWTCVAEVSNPFPFAVDATAGVVPRHGAFETEGLPRRFHLARGAEQRVEFGLAGGSWRVGGDPLFFVLYAWQGTRARAAGKLLLDAPLARVRTAVADALARRLSLLRESPSDPPASMVLRRRGRDLFVALENAAGLPDPRTLVFLDGRHLRGGRGVRARLPEDFDARKDGIPFSCGLEATANGERVVRRFAGGIPDEDGVGAPGRLKPLGAA